MEGRALINVDGEAFKGGIEALKGDGKALKGSENALKGEGMMRKR